MHHALRLPEILYAIFTYIKVREDIFTCALVCRFWSPWALEVLQNTRQISFRALVSKLGMTLKTVSIFRQEWSEVRSSDDIPEDAATAFRRRCRSVSDLKIDDQDPKLPASQLGIVRKVLGLPDELTSSPRNTFPSLHTLFISIDNRKKPALDPTWALFLGSSIINLTIRGRYWGWPEEFTQTTVVDSVATHVPFLQSLVLDLCAYETGPNFALFSNLRSLHWLRSTVNLEAWTSIAKLPELEELKLVDLQDIFGTPGPGLREWRAQHGSTNLLFPSLKSVVVGGDMDQAFIALLVFGSTMPRLETLSIDSRYLRRPRHKDNIIRHLKDNSAGFCGLMETVCPV